MELIAKVTGMKESQIKVLLDIRKIEYISLTNEVFNCTFSCLRSVP